MRAPRDMVKFQPEHLFYLADRARADEREQWVALEGKPYEPKEFAAYVMSRPGPAFTVLGRDGHPIAAGGYFWVSHGVWQSWMVGTPDGWEKQWRTLTKAARWLIDAMFEVGAKRLETYVCANRTRAIEWYERGLGLVFDRAFPDYAPGVSAARYVRSV